MTAAAADSSRNSFLDVVRTVAILRVVVWHAYGYAWISYLVASMPAMFFVAGSLMARSLGRAGGVSVIYRRFRRLLIPFWLYGLVAVTVMFAYERESALSIADVPGRAIAWWLFPAWDPEGSKWGLTLWAPLWYLRCLTWLLLASPLLVFAWRRTGWALLVVPLGGMAVAEYQRRQGHALPWQVEDLGLYATFWILGFAYEGKRFATFHLVDRLVLCAAFVAMGAAWAVTQPVPGHVVNASAPLHLFAGLAWLFGALSVEGWLARSAQRPSISGVIYWVNERALTIYLWHAAGLFVMYRLLWAEDRSDVARKVLALPIVLAVTFLCVIAFGWLEDAAGGRRPRIWPARPGVARLNRIRLTAVAVPGLIVIVAAVVLIGAAGQSVADGAGIDAEQLNRQTVPPSGVGLQIRTSRIQVAAAPPVQRTNSGISSAVTVDELQRETEDWLRESGLTGVSLTLLRPSGEGWSAAIGHHASGEPFDIDEAYDTASVTKTFTAALVLRLVEGGLVALDDPLSRFVPDYPAAANVTVRQLLQHTSGLIATDGIAPFDALELAANKGLQSEPGTAFRYSSPGYYMLGLVIEQVMGVSYTRALHQDLLGPLGLNATFMDEESNPLPESTHPYRADRYGYEGITWTSGGLHLEIVPEFEYHGRLWTSAGLRSTTNDLARWTLDLWGSDRVVSAGSLEAMTTFLGPEFQYAGLATYPYCPCWREGERIRAERWGHLGLTGLIEYDPVDRIALAVSTSGTTVDEQVIVALDDLSLRLRRLVRGREMPMAERIARRP